MQREPGTQRERGVLFSRCRGEGEAWEQRTLPRRDGGGGGGSGGEGL